ncbi:4-hydroxybenzoate 3-monooxygenase [Pararhizobium sp. IMCC21322]|uniref:4-hydroxybenzoate 3-monooxygenase n=1 Tax=Pararhizobium sp. IMCC21322 TaxID=3067903 RepID=UPI002740C4FD|nr:4-hydroxybenzoate 3-monooxygenase [Pararhizobium sp. IMCC21322]
MRTQVVIIGGGPSGLLLSQLLHLAGVDSIVLERKSRAYVLSRIRAGVLEQGTCDLMRAADAGAQMDRLGKTHNGFLMAFGGRTARIDLEGLTGGKTVLVYGQTDLTRDLHEARDRLNGTILHEVDDVELNNLDGEAPFVTFLHNGETQRIDCDFVAGCDGFHGVCRRSIPDTFRIEYEKVCPFAWIGVLSETRPAGEEIIYSRSQAGFALCSMRSDTLSRYYIQCPVTDTLEDWSDDRFWSELSARLPASIADQLDTGPSLQKNMAPLRAFISEPMRHGRLFLAGDAAHIVPPTGAKGLNLAASDIFYLSNAVIDFYKSGSETGLDAYSQKALARVWKATRFSWFMTRMLHNFEGPDSFDDRLQDAQLDYMSRSKAQQAAIAENYVGLPF